MANLARQNILVLLELGFTFWCREVEAALPARFRTYFGQTRWLLFKPVNPNTLPTVANLRPLAVVIDPTSFLLLQIDLPLVPTWQLAKLMRFELHQHVPLPLDQVVTDFRIIHRHSDTGRMRVELVILRREVAAAALSAAKAHGLAPDALAIPSDQGLWFARRPLQATWREVMRRPRVRRLAIKLAVPMGLALLCIGAVQSWAGRFAANREAEIATLRQQAAPIAPLRQQLIALDAKLTYLAKASARPSAATIAEEVAQRLPDDAWLQELDIEDQTVTLLGTAQHATALLKVFSDSPLFSDVHFEAPLTPAFSGNGQQFDIAMTRN